MFGSVKNKNICWNSTFFKFWIEIWLNSLKYQFLVVTFILEKSTWNQPIAPDLMNEFLLSTTLPKETKAHWIARIWSAE